MFCKLQKVGNVNCPIAIKVGIGGLGGGIRRHISQENRSVGTAACQGETVRRIRYRIDVIRMASEDGLLLPAFHIPQPNRSVPTPTRQDVAVRTQSNTGNPFRMSGEDFQEIRSHNIPQPNAMVFIFPVFKSPTAQSSFG